MVGGVRGGRVGDGGGRRWASRLPLGRTEDSYGADSQLIAPCPSHYEHIKGRSEDGASGGGAGGGGLSPQQAG